MKAGIVELAEGELDAALGLNPMRRPDDTRAVADDLVRNGFLTHHEGPVRLTDIGEKSTIVAGPRATIIAETTGYERSRIANARRMVACWNLCEGISTEYLESIPTVGGWRASLSSALKRIGNR